jgi:hypothetical protein
MRCSQTTLLRVACPIPSPTTPYGPGELRQAFHDVRNALEQIDARRALLDDVHRDFFDSDAAAIGANHEFTRKDVLVDQTGAHGVDERRPAKCFEPVRVGSAELEQDLEERRIRHARRVANQGPIVGRAHGKLAADDEVGFAGLQDVDRALVEVGVAKVNLLANDDLAPREQDALLQGLSVVRLAQADDLDLAIRRVGVLRGKLLADLDGPVF